MSTVDLMWSTAWAVIFTYYWIRDIQEGPERYGGEQNDHG